MNFIRFIRQYGPVPRNENMYDETIQRAAHRNGSLPIEFTHPAEEQILECLQGDPKSVMLTGTAGEGKTHLCRKVWERLGGERSAWASNNPYLSLMYNGRQIHFIRDLSAFAPQQGLEWPKASLDLMIQFCSSLYQPQDDVFVVAANDGQLIESWERLPMIDGVQTVRALFEDLLVEDKQEKEGVNLRFFNLSRWSSKDLFERALGAFILHPGWSELDPSENAFWSEVCPIRRNFEILKTDLFQQRILALFALCDQNGSHIPIRQMLMLLVNAVLGHPDVKDGVMTQDDVGEILRDGTISRASIYRNVFGMNLPGTRRLELTVFDYFDRFQIGSETSNRIDNLLIFGEHDNRMRPYFDQLLGIDQFYGADESYRAAKQRYIDGAEGDDENDQAFIEMLITQRQRLFFVIPPGLEEEFRLWKLTVFNSAGEYLHEVVEPLSSGRSVRRMIVTRLVKGLNRVFSGMLVNCERELYLVTGGSSTQAKVCRLFVECLSVDPRKGERIYLEWDRTAKRVVLVVQFSRDAVERFDMSLTRFEFLSRIAENGALPASFSKECYEDMLSFKGRLLAAYRSLAGADYSVLESDGQVLLRFFTLSEDGTPAEPHTVEVIL